MIDTPRLTAGSSSEKLDEAEHTSPELHKNVILMVINGDMIDFHQ